MDPLDFVTTMPHLTASLLSMTIGAQGPTLTSSTACTSAAQALGDLEDAGCPTRHLRLHGYHANADRFGRLSVFGADAPEIDKLMRSGPGMGEPIHPRLDLTPAEIVWGCREEMARTLDDMLARRSRSLILDARAAIEAAPRVAAVMADELGFDGTWVTSQVSAFVAIARGYVWPPEA